MNSSNFTKFRTELNILKESGYNFSDPAEVVELFEQKVSQWTGAPYAVAVDCATHAIELCLRYTGPWDIITVPKHTYLSVPQTVRKLNYHVRWSDEQWQGLYHLSPAPIIDSSLRFSKDMYQTGLFFCLSFQIKKHIPIGRGGMILTDNKEAYEWFKKAVHDGRTPGKLWKDDVINQMGFHYYMTPEDAARGIMLMDLPQNNYQDIGGWDNYPDLTEQSFFQRINQWN